MSQPKSGNGICETSQLSITAVLSEPIPLALTKNPGVATPSARGFSAHESQFPDLMTEWTAFLRANAPAGHDIFTWCETLGGYRAAKDLFNAQKANRS